MSLFLQLWKANRKDKTSSVDKFSSINRYQGANFVTRFGELSHHMLNKF